MIREKRITLVALVITIVILIILATVEIGTIFVDEGLIKKSEKTKNYRANAETQTN